MNGNIPIVQKSALLLAATACLFGVACNKKVAVSAPPAPQSAPQRAAATPSKNSAPIRTERAAAPAAAPERPNYPNAETRARIDELLNRIEDAYFDYDKATLRPDAVKALTADSTELKNILKDYPDYKLTVEGHCDERGSAEYNVALGDRRAKAAKEYLVSVGIPSNQLHEISYGKERPVCTDNTEACWQRNRRTHIIALNQ